MNLIKCSLSLPCNASSYHAWLEKSDKEDLLGQYPQKECFGQEEIRGLSRKPVQSPIHLLALHP